MSWNRILIACLALSPAGCGGEPDTRPIEQVRVCKGTPPRLGVTSAERFGWRDPGASEPEPSIELEWDLPEGWRELPPAQFRDVNLGAPGGVEAWVTRLAGDGGGALGNVNRWRGQFGLPPTDQEGIAALPRRPLLGQDALRVDLTAPGGGDDARRMIGIALFAAGGAVFVRMQGTNTAVEAELGRLDEFCDSLRLRAAEPRSPDAAAAAGEAGAEGLRWTVPESWQPLPPKELRLAYYRAADGVEAWITKLAGDGGGLLMNVNRWRGQVGLPPASAEDLDALPRIDVLGQPSPLVEAHGDAQGLVGVACLLPNASLFAKLVGPPDAVRAEKARFIAFCQSLRM